MKLHCKICSLNGTNLSKDSEIAEINTSKLNLPLTYDMFTSIDPEAGIPDPWLDGVEWDTMICPRGKHLPWGIDFDDTEQAMEDGGPRQILTDDGIVETQKEENPAYKIFTCEKCGRQIKSKLAFGNHYRACKGGLNE